MNLHRCSNADPEPLHSTGDLKVALLAAEELGYPVRLIPAVCLYFQPGSDGVIVARDVADLEHKFEWVREMPVVRTVILSRHQYGREA